MVVARNDENDFIRTAGYIGADCMCFRYDRVMDAVVDDTDQCAAYWITRVVRGLRRGFGQSIFAGSKATQNVPIRERLVQWR